MYKVRLLASAYQEGKALPGFVRQRFKRIIDSLTEEARPQNSSALTINVDISWEARRIRIDSGRIIYAIDDEFQQVAVLIIRKRPPYDDEDLSELLNCLE